MSGSGYLLGGGFEFKLSMVATSASIFVDYTRNIATLNGPAYTANENAGIWMLGVTVGL